MYVLAFCISDLTLTTVLFAHGYNYKFYFLESTYFYTFSTSMFELWIFSALRLCVTSGTLLGLLMNRDGSATARINRTKIVVLLLSATMWMYSIVKLLAYSEHVRNVTDPWFWSLFVWSVFSAVSFYMNWHLLGKTWESSAGTLPINNAGEDREDLLGGDGKDAEEEEADSASPKKPKMPTVWRLVSYSRPDVGLILVAIFFMLVSSVGTYVCRVTLRELELLAHTVLYTYTHARMHTRTCTYTHTHIHTHMHAYTHARIHTYTHTHTHAHTHTHTRMHTHTQAHTHRHTHAQTHRHTRTDTHTHRHTHMHAYTYTHTYTCTHAHTHTLTYNLDSIIVAIL